MEAEVLEEYKCPICFDIPPAEIYQCKQGHIICSACSTDLSECPQCRELFEETKIRNRILEHLLDKIKFSCVHKAAGCTEKVPRCEIPTHFQNCSFKQYFVKLCHHFGLSCNFQVNIKHVAAAVDHFVKNHNALLCKYSSVKIPLEGISDPARNKISMWPPIILDLEEKFGVILLIASLYHDKDGTISLICFQLNDSETHPISTDFRVEYYFKAVNSTQNLDILLNTQIVDVCKAGIALKHPIVQLSMDHLRTNYSSNDTIVMRCTISKLITTSDNVLNLSNTFNAPGSMNLTPSAPLPSPPGSQLKSTGAPPLPPKPPKSPTKADLLAKEDRKLKSHHSFKQAKASLYSSFREKSNEDKFKDEVCNTCGGTIILTLFKCLQCSSYRLCESCFVQGEHKQHVFAVIRNKKQNKAFKSQSKKAMSQFFIPNPHSVQETGSKATSTTVAVCSSCSNSKDSVRAQMYVCLLCKPVYVYCDQCFLHMSQLHEKDHYFAVVDTEEKVELVLNNLKSK